MPPSKDTITEQFYSQVSESIKLVFDLTSRIDERVKMLVERQNDVEERLDKFLEIQQQLIHRVAVIEAKEEEIDELKETIHSMRNKMQLLELKCETLQLKEASHARKWGVIFDFAFRFAFMIFGGWLLWKFGWQQPPNP